MLSRPLTRCGSDGHVLTRPPEIEVQITEVLALDAAAIRARATISDRDSPAYLKKETLVYLIREAHRHADNEMCDVVAGVLLRRCEPQAQKYLQALGQEFADAHADLIADLFDAILDLEKDTGDFLQVRFGRDFRFRAIHTFKTYTKRINDDETMLVPMDRLAGHVDTSDQDDVRAIPLSRIRLPIMPEDRRLIAQDALAQIPEPQQTAFILRHYNQWPIEAKDPQTVCLSTYFGKTPKTISNWLKLADEIRERCRGEEP